MGKKEEKDMEGVPRPHVVAVPYGGQGHLIPFMELAKLLAFHGALVSYVTTPTNAHLLQAQLTDTSADFIRLVSLPMPSSDEECTDTVAGIDNFGGQLLTWHRFSAPFTEWIRWQISNPPEIDVETRELWSPPVCLVADMFGDWLHNPSVNHGLPVAVFQTAGAYAASCMHWYMNNDPYKESVDAWNADVALSFDGLGFECSMKRSEMAAHMRNPDDHPITKTIHDFLRVLINRSMTGRWLLWNTFYDLDDVGLQHLKNITGRPVLPVGPMLPAATFVTDRDKRTRRLDSMGRVADIDKHECLKWLDSRPAASVVFVCFGSQFFLSAEQIRAVAEGLEGSGQAFVWALRRPHDAESSVEFLPEGFCERTKERSLVIWGWAPQLMILSHRAVGCFFSHCGWNSVLESVTVGVPMITWPLFSDQPFNSKLLVERLKVAMQVCVDVDSVPRPDIISDAIRCMITSKEGGIMRARAKDLSNLAKLSVRSGSSYNSIKSFVDDVRQLHTTSLGW